MRISKRIMSISIILLSLSATIWATSFDGVRFPSTPFMPPKEMIWVQALFAGLFILANTLLQCRIRSLPPQSVVWLVSFLGLLLTIYATLVSMSGYYPQISSLAWGSRTLWGISWRDMADELLLMNGLGLLMAIGSALCLSYINFEDADNDMASPGCGRIALLMVTSLILSPLLFTMQPNYAILFISPLLLIAGIIKTIRRFGTKVISIILVNILVYIISFIPYTVTGAYVHGNPPFMRCDHNIKYGYGLMLLAYIRDHKGHLPTAANLNELHTQLAPYSEIDIIGKDDTIPVSCPAGYWLEHDGKSKIYIWNANISGKTVGELRKFDKAIIILSCPYHKSIYIDSHGLINSYDDPDEIFIETSHRIE